jgi:hypothetical protein
MQPLKIQEVIEEVTRRVIALTDSHSGNVLPGQNKSEGAGIGHIVDQVISTQQLNDLPHGLTIVQISHKSLITPAAADWLRERNIEVQRTDTSKIDENNYLQSKVNQWVRVTVGQLDSGASAKSSESFDCIVKAGKRCSEAIDNGYRVVLDTDAVSIALISLNRNKKMRAIAVGRHAMEVRNDASVCYANVFVVNRQSAQSTRLIQQIQLVPQLSGSPPKWL